MNTIIEKNKTLKEMTKVLFQKKMENICLIDLRKIPNLLIDYLLIGTSQSEVQMSATINEVKKVLSRKKVSKIQSEHSAGSRWGVLSAEGIILHLFEEKTREFYSLEHLWSKGDIHLLEPETMAVEIELDDEQFI